MPEPVREHGGKQCLALNKNITQRAMQGEILPTQNSPAKAYQGSALCFAFYQRRQGLVKGAVGPQR